LLRGHEFDYAAIDGAASRKPFAFVRDAHTQEEHAEGERRGSVTESFFHVIAAENP